MATTVTGGGDVAKSIFIILVFLSLTAYISSNIGMQNMKDNWALYRCNPLMMPFAASMAPEGSGITASSNFTYCTQDTIRSFGPTLMAPLNYVQSMTVDLLGDITTSTESSTKQSSWFSFKVGNVFGSLFDTVLNVMVQFNIMMIKMTDAQGKLSGAIATILYIMTAVQYSFQSMWDGIPGGMIRSFDSIRK